MTYKRKKVLTEQDEFNVKKRKEYKKILRKKIYEEGSIISPQKFAKVLGASATWIRKCAFEKDTTNFPSKELFMKINELLEIDFIFPPPIKRGRPFGYKPPGTIKRIDTLHNTLNNEDEEEF